MTLVPLFLALQFFRRDCSTCRVSSFIKWKPIRLESCSLFDLDSSRKMELFIGLKHVKTNYSK